MGRKPCGTELFTYGIWCVISRCSVRTELNCVVVLVLSCVWLLATPMDWSTPGFPVHHQLPELAQTHVRRVSDAIQPSHPVIPFSCLQSFPASRSFPISQFFASSSQNIGASASASVLLMNKRHRCIEQSFGLCGRGRGWDDLGEWHWNIYNIIYEMNRQSKFDAWYWMPEASALRRPRGMVRGGRRERGSGWGTCVHPWWIHVDVWQN